MPSRPPCNSVVQPEFDCVIVGAGLVGTTTAVALARTGCKVALVEQRPQRDPAEPDADVRALVLSPASARILDAFGLSSGLHGHTHPIEHIHVSDRGGFGSMRLSAAEVGLPALGWSCPADFLLQQSTAAARAALGERLYWSTRFVDCAMHATHVEIEVERAGQTVSLTTRLVIGADGAGSQVRAALGLAVERFDYGQTAVVANVAAERPEPACAFERFTGRGPIAMIPCGGRRYVSVQCLEHDAAAEAAALAAGPYVEMLARRFGTRLGALSEPGPRRAHALVRQRARTLVAGRGVVLGNAANTVHPNAAQGLNLGLRDAYALTQCLAGATDAGEPARLARYARARVRDHRLTSGFTDVLAQSFRSPLFSVTLGRRVALTLAELSPSLKRRFVWEASGLAALARMPQPVDSATP